MENKDLHEKFTALMNGLTDEQKAKATGCKDGKELLNLLIEAGVALPDELLDAVAGGGSWDELYLLKVYALADEICMKRGIDAYNREGQAAAFQEALAILEGQNHPGQ